MTARRAGADVFGPADLVRLRVQLRDVKPTAWRRVVVPAAIRLDHLHRVIQAAMGWEDAHLWQFHLHGVDYGPELGLNPRVPLSRFRLRAGERFSYIYDFGAWWEHEVRVEAATAPDARGPMPRCVGGNGTCPPEDCGGPAGYADAVGEALGLSADLDMAELAEFGRDLIAAVESGDFGPLRSDPERLDDLDDIVRRSERRLRLTEPFDRKAANERVRALGGGGRGDVAMTLRCTVQVETGPPSGQGWLGAAVINRPDELAPETLGLTLAEAHALLRDVQARLVAAQIERWQAAHRACRACGTVRRLKERRPLVMRTAFGEQVVQAERLRRCACGGDAGPGATVTPLAALLPERTTPELLYLETRWASLVSYGLAARILGELLPLDRPIGAERVRRHLHRVAEREEAELGPEEGYYFDGCQRDLFKMNQPDGPVVVGIDGGYVRDREGSWFEVIAGKGLSSFERDGSGGDAGDTATDVAPPGRCFAFVQAFDERPRRRMFEMLRGLGYRPNQKLVMLSDGGESVRTLGRRIGPEAEHVLDWFHVAMRVTALGQMVKGAAAEDGWRNERLSELDRAKHLLWNGHAREAESMVSWIEEEVEAELDDVTGERRARLKKLSAAVREFRVYIRRNAGSVVDYGERFRAGERISSGFVESAINQVVAKRFSKRQSMRWTRRGAHLALQTRTRVLNGELEDAFRRRWPEFRAERAA